MVPNAPAVTPPRRLIEAAFPLRETSLDSVHEKSVRHGHISTLHIWPARRPLAASRAALLATLLPDPGTPEARAQLLERIAGTVKIVEGKEVTVGGVLHWGRETSPVLDALRDELRAAFGGRAPRMLDPFSGGGAIPFEAMRLGCAVTAADINSVAWFILKCTLDYPQKLAGQKRPLPRVALDSPAFQALYNKVGGKSAGRKGRGRGDERQVAMFSAPEEDLAWHVRAWGMWVLDRARKDLERFYPTVDGKPTVAYLWARTVRCKNPNCRATVPLLKTRWLCKKASNRVLLTMTPDKEKKGVVFGVQHDVPRSREDRQLGAGTLSKSGARCPCCDTIQTMDDLRAAGSAGQFAEVMTAVVVDGPRHRDYRAPTATDIEAAKVSESVLKACFDALPFGVPDDPLPPKGTLGFSVPLYGFNHWSKLYTARQLLANGTFARWVRAAREAMKQEGYPDLWVEAIESYLALGIDRLVDRSATLCQPDPSPTQSGVMHVFSRFAMPLTWDFIEGVTIQDASGGFMNGLEWIVKVLETTLPALMKAEAPVIRRESALTDKKGGVDVIVTDPPYYDAIPYSDLMDFFYVWLRRTLFGLSGEIDVAFKEPLGAKWDHDKGDGELIDDSSRFEGKADQSKKNYEDGMARAFVRCHAALNPDGRLVIVFAHKHPDAWETLVTAIIKAGFVVTASWPIQTERTARTRALSSAALSSSVWLVCKKREVKVPGWEDAVLAEMRERMHGRYDEATKTWTTEPRLKQYWDAGIRGPDFVWAAIGPALEAYSRFPVVKRATSAQPMGVPEFLKHVRRLVVDYVVGRVLSKSEGATANAGLDDLSNYYLLHRNDFGMGDAPAGACILYAVSCNLSDRLLVESYDLLARSGHATEAEDDVEDGDGEDGGDDPDDEAPAASVKGDKVRLKAWDERRWKNLGVRIGTETVPLIDQVHKLMHVWKAGDIAPVDAYLDAMGLRVNVMFHRFLQALIELAPPASEERSLLESLSNHVMKKGLAHAAVSGELALGPTEPGDKER